MFKYIVLSIYLLILGNVEGSQSGTCIELLK